MKIIREEILTNQEALSSDLELKAAYIDILDSILKVCWPESTSAFKLNPVMKGNGVKPIKYECMEFLKSKGWETEIKIDIASRVKPGPLDAGLYLSNSTYAAIEWETGNISSSHRALNKIALGCMKGIVSLGVLVLPSREMYKYLTDRVGNFQEIEPYLDVWRNIKTEGVIGVIEVEHDSTDPGSPLIPKGTDGRALR